MSIADSTVVDGARGGATPGARAVVVGVAASICGAREHAAAPTSTAHPVATTATTIHHRRVAPSRKGRLLIALPILADPNFDRTVVLMIEDNEQGSAGLVLNRPSPVPVVQALPELAGAVAPPTVLFFGGPVNQDTAIGLARN